MPCDSCQATIIPQREVIAANAIKFCKAMVSQIENDSRDDKFALLKEKITQFDAVADSILAAHVLITIDDCSYLTPQADRK